MALVFGRGAKIAGTVIRARTGDEDTEMSVKLWKRQVRILNRAVPRENAESAPERDSESGLRARTEFESEVRKSD